MVKSNEIVLNGAQIVVHAHVALNIGTQSAELFFESTVDQKKFRTGGPYRILSQVLSFRALFFASGLVCSPRNKNKILYYTRCRSKRVTSWRAHLRIIALAGNTTPFEEMSQR